MSVSFARLTWGLLALMVNWWNPASSSSAPAYASSAEEVLDNSYLLDQILIYIPVTSLLRLRGVSKKWNHIITSREFGVTHTKRDRHPKSTSLMMYHNHRWILLPIGADQNQNSPAIKTLDFDYLGAEMIKVVNSCNGLSLCYIRSFRVSYHAFVVTNTTSKRFFKLPWSELMMHRKIYKLALAFDPASAPSFKVLCVAEITEDVEYAMEIYSTKTHQWRRWHGSFINLRFMMEVFEQGVVWNGSIHWVCPIGDSFCFSIQDESMMVLQLPPRIKGSLKAKSVRLMGQYGGYLHLVDIEYNYENSPPMKIYRKQVNGDWFLKQRVRLSHINSRLNEFLGFGPDDVPNRPLGDWYSFSLLSLIWAEDGRSFDMILLVPGHVVCYNTRTRTLRELLRIHGFTGIHDFKWYHLFQLSESLSWLPPPV